MATSLLGLNLGNTENQPSGSAIGLTNAENEMDSGSEARVLSLSSRVHDFNVKMDGAMPDKTKVVVACVLTAGTVAGGYYLYKKGHFEPERHRTVGIVAGVVVLVTVVSLAFYAAKDFDDDDVDDVDDVDEEEPVSVVATDATTASILSGLLGKMRKKQADEQQPKQWLVGPNGQMRLPGSNTGGHQKPNFGTKTNATTASLFSAGNKIGNNLFGV